MMPLVEGEVGKKPLEGKIALVTNAGRGIGLATVEGLATAGADVVCVTRTSESAAIAEATVESLGRRIWPVVVDVSSYKDIESILLPNIKAIGRIDVLVNCAGVTRDNFLVKMSEEEWDQVIDTNLKGCFNVTRNIIRMVPRGGRIINVGSVIGEMGGSSQCNYAASKAGLVGFTRALAKEYASRDITVNLVAPGFVITDMTQNLDEKVRADYLSKIPLKRFAIPSEIAELIVFLAAIRSNYITGQVITIDGGLS